MIIRWLYDDRYQDRLNDPVLASFATELLRAHRSGNHLAVLDRKMAQVLKDGVDLTVRDKVLLDRLSSEYSQTGNLYRRASVYIDVVPSSDDAPNKMGSAIIFPLNKLIASRSLERPILLSENVDKDGWAYDYIIKNINDILLCPNVDLELSHGGGADTPTVFKHYITNSRIVCAIIDSDKRSPTSPDSEKIRRMRKASLDLAWPVSFAFALPCHEIENLIPHDLATTLPSGIVNASNETLLTIAQSELTGNCDPSDYYWLYFDNKEGIKSTHRDGFSAEEWRWTTEKLALAGIPAEPWEFSGYGERVIPQIKASNSAMSEFRRLIRENKWLSTFSRFFSEFIWIFAASRPLRT
jgi:hypothetical protein